MLSSFILLLRVHATVLCVTLSLGEANVVDLGQTQADEFTMIQTAAIPEESAGPGSLFRTPVRSAALVRSGGFGPDSGMNSSVLGLVLRCCIATVAFVLVMKPRRLQAKPSKMHAATTITRCQAIREGAFEQEDFESLRFPSYGRAKTTKPSPHHEFLLAWDCFQ